MSQFVHAIQLQPATGSAAKLGRYLEITRADDQVTNVSLPGSCSSYNVVLSEGEVVSVRLGYPTKADSAAWDSLGWTPADKLVGGVTWPKGRAGSAVEQVIVKPHNGNLVKQSTGVAVWSGDDVEVADEPECRKPSCGCVDVCEVTGDPIDSEPGVVSIDVPAEEAAEVAPKADDWDISEETLAAEEEVSEDEVDEEEDVQDEEE